MSELRGAILDFHGVLAHPETHMKARLEMLQRVAEKTGDRRFLEIDQGVHDEAHLHGRHTRDIVGWLLQRAGIVPHDAENPGDHPMVKAASALQRRIFARNAEAGADATRGAVDFVRWVQERFSSEHVAIATTGRREEIAAYLHRHDLLVGTVITREDTLDRTKPDPLVYELALDRTGLSGNVVLSVEDSPHGLHAAITAGIATRFALTTTHDKASLAGAGATEIFDSFVAIREHLVGIESAAA